ncbi:class I SAM-dependent methyltransferase [Streptomyces viridochromogenes]|uniref:class I SAM-dependent methyltransferase n=1 Tax=Streptomyces viridochromogenes TaxID=1938 RepID=UPI00069CFEEF|nr:class I SAM-dependent methyltransferase [Streptomyces viridochromogenes]KOG16088.1 SAM-dependent methyltransferase [Streptomyces viridochromogenes]KOG16405.1 SAM-dependent methyltransferase [Streptomyces viridochromogenes]
MRTLSRRLLKALEHFNAAHPWDHNAHYHRWILRQLPRRFGTALDVGCGTGDLVRLLAARADKGVVGVDSDAGIAGRARELTPPGAPVTFIVADAPGGIPEGPYDVIACVAVLHHLPLGETLARLRRQLTPGGTLVVVGLARDEGFVEQLLGFVSVPLNLLMGLVKNRGRRTMVRPVSMTAVTRPAEVPFGDIASEARRVLPGARLRRRMFWRYTLVWRG